LPVKRASERVGRATGAIERFIERTLAPRLEEMAGEIRSLRGEMAQTDKRITENVTSLRNETIARIDSIRTEGKSRFDSLRTEVHGGFDIVNSRFDNVNTRIDALSQRPDDALNIRERLVALEARFEATQKRNGA
jgi:hypothetical protein